MPSPWARGFRVRVVGKLHGQLYNNVLHFATNVEILDAPTLNARLKELANAVQECILQLLPAATEDFSFETVEAEAIAPAVTDPINSDVSVTTQGEGTTQGVGFASCLVSVRTGGGGKSGRGRMYLPPGGEDFATAGEWTAPQIALIAAFCACMAGKFIGAGATTQFRLGVLSRKTFANTPANFDAAFREATELIPQRVIASMRTRQKGKGS